MPLKLSKRDQEFRNPIIFAGDAKTIDLDRVLLNLFVLIKYFGARPITRRGRKPVTLEMLIQKLLKRENDGTVQGFSGNEEAIRCWVAGNLVDLVHRGNPGKEAVASLRAIHLNSYMYRNPKHSRDYFISEQVYSMLSASSINVIDDLRSFLGIGWDEMTKSISTGQLIDIDTLAILRIIEKDGSKENPSGDNLYKPNKCLCIGQARVFSDDIRRLMVYRNSVPRHVILEYIRILIGIHVGLYLFKLFNLLPDWVKQGKRTDTCKECSVKGDAAEPFKDCPYHLSFAVDCGNDPETDMAGISVTDATNYYARIHDYIRSTFAINMAMQFVEKIAVFAPDKKNFNDIDSALKAMKSQGTDWDSEFRLRIRDLFDDKDKKKMKRKRKNWYQFISQ